MPDLCSGLLLLFFVVAIVTLVGHGIWTVAALILRGSFGSGAQRGPDRQSCPKCGIHFGGEHSHCPSCGLNMNGALAVELRELDRAARSIQYLIDTETLDKSQGEEIYQQIEERQDELLHRQRRMATRRGAEPTLANWSAELSAAAAAPPPFTSVVVELPVADAATAPPQPAATTAQPLSEPKPRVTWGQMFGRFMEERNILWGELVGGMLIVGCSIALVISLWQTLEQIPYFPLLLFAAITAAMYGAGRYTLGHWKLEATSRGLLVIVTLLVPLDFLVLTRVTQGSTRPTLDLAVEVAAAAAFVWMTHRALRVLIGSVSLLGFRQAAGLTTAAVIGASACQLFVPHWLDLATPHVALFVLLSMTPVLCHALAQGAMLIGLTRRGDVPCGAANVLLLTLGMTTFAAAVSLGFILHWSDDQVWTLHHLAAPLALLALPLVGVGALLARRSALAEGETGAHGLSIAQCRVVGTIVALHGMLLMIGALALGWPRPPALVGLGLLNAAALTALALTYRLPAAHVPALASLTIGFVTGYHWLSGALAVAEVDLAGRLAHLASAASTGVALTVLAGIVALFSEWLQRRQRTLDAVIAGYGSGVLAILALHVAVLNTRVDSATSAWIEGLVGAGTLAANVRWRQSWLSVAASVVILGAINTVERALSLEWSPHGASPVWLIGHATLMLGALWLPARGWIRRGFASPLAMCGMITSIVAVIPLAIGVTGDTLARSALASLWLASIWFLFAWHGRRHSWFAAGQLMVTVAMLLGLFAWLDSHPDLTRSWSLDVQAAGLALAALCFVWTGVRTELPPSSRWHRLLHGIPWTVDQLIFDVVLVGQVLSIGLALAPFLAGELLLGELVPIAFSQERAWSMLGILGATLTLRLWQPRVHETNLGWILVAASCASLPALAWHEANSVTAALRWGLALAFLAISTPIWMRDRLRSLAKGMGIAGVEAPRRNMPREYRMLTLLLTVIPVLALTTIMALQGFAGAQLPPPSAGSWFAKLGWVSSMVIPLGLIIPGLLGYGVREDAPGYIFAAGLVTLGTVSGGHALGLITSGIGIDAAATVFIGQLAAAAASLWLVGWLVTRRWRSMPMLGVQLLIAGFFHLILLGPACAGLLIALDGVPFVFVEATGHWLGWIGLLAWIVGALWLCDLTTPGRCVHALGIGGLGVGVLVACWTLRFDAAGWLSYHSLTVVWTLTALALLVGAWVGAAAAGLGPIFWSEERRAAAAARLKARLPQTAARRWVEALSAIVLLLALGGAWGDPTRPYGACSAVLAISVLFGAMAMWTRRSGYVYVSGLLVNFAAYLVWQAWLVDVWGVRAWFLGRPELFDRFVLLQVLACALGSVIWSLVEIVMRRREPAVDLRGKTVPFPYAAALIGLQLLAIYVLVGIAANVMDMDLRLDCDWAWLALAAIGVALALGFWDPEARHWGMPAAPLYVAGLLGVGLGLHPLGLSPREFAWWACLALAGYALAVSVIARLPLPLERWCRWPEQSASRWADWFVPMQMVLGLTALGLSLWIVVDFNSIVERLAGPLAVAMIAGAACSMAHGSDRWASSDHGTVAQSLARQLPTLGLSLGVFVAVELLWAAVDPSGPAPWLQRSAGLFLVMAVATPLYGVALPRQPLTRPRWAAAAKQLGRQLLWASVALLVLLFAQQFALYDNHEDLRQTPLNLGLMLAVAAVLGAYLVGTIVIAVAPRLDPLDLSDHGRVMSVWLAELFLALLFLHLRLNVPDLIPSVLGRNWAFVLMTLGFLGVGLGELFGRRDLPMLAEPLFRTGLVLPLVPLSAYLIKPLVGLADLGDAVPGLQPLLRYLERLPANYGVHAGLWFLLGMLYGLTAVLRRSSWFALATALAGNFGLWVVYAHHPGLAFTLHPQLWLAPLGVLVLVAERLHGEQLTPGQAQGVRYFGLMLIYTSSSFDMFIHGLGNSVLLPIVLAVLSVLGVLAGILWRVRAFLLCGVAFLGLVIFSQIWHAAVQRGHVWVWYAAGLILGAAMFALFAIFEKRRNDVLRLLDDFRHWR